MNTTNNLQLARNYEWDIMIAKYKGNKDEAVRYEALQKMAMLNAASSYSKNVPYSGSYYNRYLNWVPSSMFHLFVECYT